MTLYIELITEQSQPNLDYLGPVVTSVGLVIVAGISGVSAVWRRKQDRKERTEDTAADTAAATQPKVTDGWEEVRRARAESTTYYNLLVVFREMYYMTISALRHLVRQVRHAHPDHEFDKEVVKALELEPPETK